MFHKIQVSLTVGKLLSDYMAQHFQTTAIFIPAAVKTFYLPEAD